MPSASVGARQRLGAAPLAWLFDQLGHHWTQVAPTPEACFHGLRPLAVDGVVWATPDTPHNRQAYGSTANQHQISVWPQVGATCLMDTQTHLIRAASLTGMALGEPTSARDLIAHVPDHSLTLFDRLYYAAAFLLDWQHAGTERYWFMRARSSLRHRVVATFGPGDWWVRLPVSPQRLSFQWLTLAITMALTGWPLEEPKALPGRLQLLRKIAAWHLPPPRRPRSYPRVIKQSSRSYPRKNASQLN